MNTRQMVGKGELIAYTILPTQTEDFFLLVQADRNFAISYPELKSQPNYIIFNQLNLSCTIVHTCYTKMTDAFLHIIYLYL